MERRQGVMDGELKLCKCVFCKASEWPQGLVRPSCALTLRLVFL